MEKSKIDWMNRRDFMAASSGLAGAAFLGFGCGRENVGSGKQHLYNIGVQLYTVRSLMPGNVEQTLAEIAEIGYDEVEFAGYFNHSPEAIRTMLDNVGLTAPSSHIDLPILRDNVQKVIDDALVVGHDYVVLPWLQHEDMTIDDYKALADECNVIGEEMKGAGIQFAYHNHAFEFVELEGELPMEVLLDRTDPEFMVWEMDFFWVTHAGLNPLDYISRYQGRVELCHVKDRDVSGTMVDVGAGAIDFEALFAASKSAGFQHYFIEHDDPEAPMSFARTSHDYLASLEFTPREQ